jgi:hypothetical protein
VENGIENIFMDMVLEKKNFKNTFVKKTTLVTFTLVPTIVIAL